jgi:hypothetical protein
VIEENVKRFTERLDSLAVDPVPARHDRLELEEGAKISDSCEKSRKVDLLTWLNYLTFDVLSYVSTFILFILPWRGILI